MPPLNHAEQYLRQQIEQASPLQQVVMLCDGCIKFIQHAKEAIGRNDIQARFNATQRASAILNHLMDMLDPERGGPAAASLHRIYGGLMVRLLEVNLKNNAALCDELVQNLRLLRQTWAQASLPTASSAPTVTEPSVVAGPNPSSAALLAALKRNAVA